MSTARHLSLLAPARLRAIRFVCAVLVLFAGLLAAPLAHAVESCVVSANAVAFGVYDPTAAAPLNGASQVTVDCQGNKFVPVVITLSTGSGSYATRQMTSTFDVLQYNLYLDANRSIVFGDGTGGSQSASCTTGVTSGFCIGSNPSGTYRRVVLPFYGRITELQNVASGSYSDDLQVTITF
jgi:spore coat protein U-like protein